MMAPCATRLALVLSSTLSMVGAGCQHSSPAAPPAQKSVTGPSLKPKEEKLVPEEGGCAKKGSVIYRLEPDGALTYATDEVIEGGLPAGYQTLPGEQAPPSLAALLRGHRSVFEPGRAGQSCRKLEFGSITRRTAKVFEDESRNDCLVRYQMRLEYWPGALGTAELDLAVEGQRVLRGCAHMGFGIALCGNPVFLVVGHDDEHLSLIETRGGLSRRFTFHAYDAARVTTWYFNAEQCERASPKNNYGSAAKWPDM